MDRYYDMKLASISLAKASRSLRNWELKCVKKARRDKSTNFPKWDERRQGFYKERMMLRKDARYLHLARGFLFGKDYKEIEQSVREGNEPVAETIACVAAVAFDVDRVRVDAVEQWINKVA